MNFVQLIQPLFPLRNDYFHQNNIDLPVEIIHCIQAIWRNWSRQSITTLSSPSMFMSRFIPTDYHAGQIFIPHRPLVIRSAKRDNSSAKVANISLLVFFSLSSFCFIVWTGQNYDES